VSTPSPRRSLLRTTLLLVPMQVVFRGGEALLPLLLAAWFGRNDTTDVYYFAWAVFAFAGSLVFSAYQDSALVPILAEVKLAEPSQVPTVTGSLLAHTLAWGGALAMAIGVVALAWFGIRYSGPDLTVAAKMVVPFCLYLVALSVRTFFVAILNADHRFFAYPVSSCVGIVTTIALIAGGRHALGVLAIPTASLAGELVAIAVLSWITFGACRMRMRLSFERPEPVRKFAKLIASEVGGGAVTRVNPVVDQLMATLAGVVGGGTLLRYSSDVASLPTSLLQATLLPVLLSHLSDDYAGGSVERLRSTIHRTLLTVCAVLLGFAALLFVVREPLLRFVFLRGRMDAPGVERMISLLPYHLIGLAPFGALLVLARAHVATKNSGIMLSMGILNATLNVVFNVILLRAIGLEGIALSTSCVQLAIAIVFWFRLDTRLAELREAPT
jgi:putative peptidoglycan lipid II flippase